METLGSILALLASGNLGSTKRYSILRFICATSTAGTVQIRTGGASGTVVLPATTVAAGQVIEIRAYVDDPYFDLTSCTGSVVFNQLAP